jgi:hypothetical protein
VRDHADPGRTGAVAGPPQPVDGVLLPGHAEKDNGYRYRRRNGQKRQSRAFRVEAGAAVFYARGVLGNADSSIAMTAVQAVSSIRIAAGLAPAVVRG